MSPTQGGRAILMPTSGCPPTSAGCSVDVKLPALPSDLVFVAQVASACAVLLFLLAFLSVAIANRRRTGRWRTDRPAVATAVLGGLCLLLAWRAWDAYHPFARLQMSPGASYNDWVQRAGYATIQRFSTTVVALRGLMVIGVLLTIATCMTVIVRSVGEVRRRRRDTAISGQHAYP